MTNNEIQSLKSGDVVILNTSNASKKLSLGLVECVYDGAVSAFVKFWWMVDQENTMKGNYGDDVVGLDPVGNTGFHAPAFLFDKSQVVDKLYNGLPNLSL